MEMEMGDKTRTMKMKYKTKIKQNQENKSNFPKPRFELLVIENNIMLYHLKDGAINKIGTG
jgi:hypothetical protein